MSDSQWPDGLQDARLLRPPLSPTVCSDSCPLCQWRYLIVSSSATPFSFCPQSFPFSGSFPKSQLFASGDQSIGASASVVPMNIQGWFPLRLTKMLSLSKTWRIPRNMNCCLSRSVLYWSYSLYVWSRPLVQFLDLGTINILDNSLRWPAVLCTRGGLASLASIY